MSDLFIAGMNRLWRSRVFHICCLVSFVANVFVMLATYRQLLNYESLGLERSITLDNVFYGLIPVLGVMCSVFASLFIGTVHSDGVMRNMLVVGRARWEIYLANYAVCFVAAVAFLVCWFLGGLTGVPLIGVWQDVNGLLLRCAVLLSVALLMLSSYMLNALNQPEFQQGVMMTEAGPQLSDPMPNPSYVGGMKREVFRFLSDTLPSGQSISVCSYELERPVLSLVSSAVIALLTTAVGVICFRRKDIR